MEIKIVHPFIFRCHNIDNLLKDVNKLSAFCKNLERQSILFQDRYDSEKYKGDGLELFSEVLIKLSPMDNRIGIGNYEPITSNDIGVDGKGIGLNGKPATVQVKYRSNHKQMLTANEDHLSNFVMASLLHFNIDKEDKNNMLIVTTAGSLSPFVKEEMYVDKVRCLAYEDLRGLVDNNNLFWNKFRLLVRG